MEQRVCKVSATVMIYNDQDRRWLHAGENSGSNISTISILVNEATSKYRIVAQKQDPPREVTVNMNIQKSLRYHVATPTFHQWRDSKIVYGLNFVSEDHAQDFSNKLQSILQNLKLAAQQQPPSYNPNEAYNNNPRQTLQQYSQPQQAPMVKNQYNNQPKMPVKASNPMLATSTQNVSMNGHSFRQEQNFNNFSNPQQNYPTDEFKQMQMQETIRQEQTDSLDDNSQYNPQKKIVQEPVKELPKTTVPPPPPPPPGPGGLGPKPNGFGPPPPPGPPPMGNTSRPTLPNSLQDQIKGFGNLKKPTSSTPPQPKPAVSSGGGDFMSELRKKLERKTEPTKRSDPIQLQSFNTITPTKQEMKSLKPKSVEESNKVSLNATNSERNSPLNRFNSTAPRDNFENKIDQLLSAVQCIDSKFDKMKSDLKIELCEEFRKIVREELKLMMKCDN